MGKPAFSGLCEAWLKEKLTKYMLVKPVDCNAFVADTIRCFLKRFPVSLGDNEPTEESLNSVDNSVTEREDPAPEKKVADQITHWLPYHLSKTSKSKAPRKDECNSYSEAMRTRIMGLPLTKPQKLPAHLVWAHANKDLIDALRADSKSAPEQPAGQSQSANTAASNYQAAVKAGFNALTEEEKAEWEERAEEDAKLAHSDWKKSSEDEADTSPEACQN
ncbi:hypothetical protein BT96DRAFT_1008589 [Gymnopus androsaceus JB14]|uniref:Uncharacterized protein n=1 Tax=Gymnopus androsaceus JB14 TaxID=1447944 RepID=A0A6A4GEF0_9AGAR|nr:hypothetical protein BT96DRAFT_1008589 [Gymnopus androsaceus JB14]